jgi:hypothetical protein
MKNFFENLKNDKTTVIYISIIIILIIFGVLLLLQDTKIKPETLPKVNVAITPVANIEITTADFFSNITAPDNFKTEQHQYGSATDSYKLYSQTITNPEKTLKIVIEAVPSNADKRLNTGVSLQDNPDEKLKNNMVFLKLLENNELYREDGTLKYELAYSDYQAGNTSSFYISGDNKLVFKIFEKTNNDYHSRFKTLNNQEVTITVIIDFTLNKDSFLTTLNQADEIIKSIKV